MNQHVNMPLKTSGVKITVLMAVYNGEKYLRDAIESILCQTFRDFEFLIVNDGSTDGSISIIESYDDPRIVVLNNDKNIGLTRSLNRGLSVARSEFIARQDADDVSHPERLSKQVSFLDKHQDVAVVGTQARYIDAQGDEILVQGWSKLQSNFGIRWQVMFDSPFVHTSVMFRHSIVWSAEGGYNEIYITNQDFELWSRLKDKYILRNLPGQMVDLRQHGDSVSANYSRDQVEKVRPIFLKNIEIGVGGYPLASRWVEISMNLNLLRVSNFDVCANEYAQHLWDMYQRFLTHQSYVAGCDEVKCHLADLMVRGAKVFVKRDIKGSVILLFRAFKIAPLYTLNLVPFFIRRLLQ